MKISLLDNHYILIDEDDIDLLDHDVWKVSTNKKTGYQFVYKKGMITLHRVIMARILGEEFDPELPVKHLNGNRLDFRRDNLRQLTHQQKSWISRGKERYHKGLPLPKGVYPTEYNKFVATIQGDYLGVFDTIPEAKEAYEKEAVERYTL